MFSLAEYDVTDLKLAEEGRLRIEWAEKEMPVLRLIRERFKRERPLEGTTLAACLHVTAETANLIITLKEGGAKVLLCASNPLSTQDDVAASLVKNNGISVFARKFEDNKTYYSHIKAVLDAHPNMTMDDGADLVSELHKNRPGQIKEIVGSSEETTTGVIRLKAMEKDGALKFPVVAVNDSDTKHMFDNRYGTGQSTLDGLLRATNILLAGRTFTVVGYGYCGKGLAERARGMGASVIVCEQDPVRALEAVMDGFTVMPTVEAAKKSDVMITVTGNKNVIDSQHFKVMKDGCILGNSGHFNAEINIPALEKMSKSKRTIRKFVEEYSVDGKKIHLLAEGRLLNLAAAEGHPATVMDMSFANQALAAEWILKNKGRLKNVVHRLPEDIDKTIASIKLESLGVKTDKLTAEQQKYLASWQEGT